LIELRAGREYVGLGARHRELVIGRVNPCDDLPLGQNRANLEAWVVGDDSPADLGDRLPDVRRAHPAVTHGTGNDVHPWCRDNPHRARRVGAGDLYRPGPAVHQRHQYRRTECGDDE